MQVPSGYLEALTSAINALTANAQEAARAIIAHMLADGVTDPEEIVEALAEALEPIFEALTSESASLSATSYDFLRSAMVGYPLGAAPYPSHDPAYTLQAMEGMAAKHKWNMDAFTKAVIDRLDYEAKRAAGQTMFSNGADDPRKPRFARVPTGAETCPFCVMLASRGFVYHGERSAGKLDHYHPNCDCRVVPSFGGGTIEGYDPDHWLDLYAEMMDNGTLDADALARSAARAKLRRREEAALEEARGLEEIRRDLSAGKVLAFEAKGPEGRQVTFGMHPVALDNIRVGLGGLGYDKGQSAEMAREMMRRSSGHSFKESKRGHDLYEQNVRMAGPDGKMGRVLLTWKMNGGSAVLVDADLLKMGAKR